MTVCVYSEIGVIIMQGMLGQHEVRIYISSQRIYHFRHTVVCISYMVYQYSVGQQERYSLEIIILLLSLTLVPAGQFKHVSCLQNGA